MVVRALSIMSMYFIWHSVESAPIADDPKLIPMRMRVMFALPVPAMCMPDRSFRICSASLSQIGHFLSQPNSSRVVKFLTWVRRMRLNQV